MDEQRNEAPAGSTVLGYPIEIARGENVPCKACGAPCVMVQHERTRKFGPIEATPRENGNVIIYGDGCYGIIKKGLVIWGPRYVSHYARCPQSRLFRDQAKKEPAPATAAQSEG